MSKLFNFLLTPCLLILILTASAAAQSSTATLSGTVEDERGALVPGAAITVKNYATSLERHATTNDSGSFTIPLLPPGEYTVLVEREGFTRVQLTHIVLNVGDQKAVQVQLKVGDIASTVEVRSDEALINTSSAVTNTIDRTFVGNLPLQGRSFQSLILLTPGVTVTPVTPGNPGQFSVNGQRSTANVFTVDGVSGNSSGGSAGGGTVGATSFDLSQGLAGNTPSLTATGGTNGMVAVDALEEFRIQTSTYSAEYGRSPGGQISLITRSGKNQFQGSLFEYFRNEKLDANDWFANASGQERAPLRQNMFGGYLGGPIFLPRFGEGGPSWYNGRNRSFFFFTYEGLRLLLPQTRVNNVPSLRLRGIAAPAVQKLLNAFPLPTGPESLTATACVQPLPPAPPNSQCSGSQTGNRNGFLYSGFAPLTSSISDPSSHDIAGIRIDHNLGKNLTIFGRYNHAFSTSSVRGGIASSGSGNRAIIGELEVKTKTLTLGSNWVIIPNINNEFRFNLTRDGSTQMARMDDFGGAVPLSLSDTIPAASLTGRVQSVFSYSTVAGTVSFIYGSGFIDTYQRPLNIVDNLIWVTGGHVFKFGFDYRRLSSGSLPLDYTQTLIFQNEDQLRNALTASVARSVTRKVRPIFENFSVYAQDTWKLTPKLTVDLGLRWDVNPPPGGDADLFYTVLGVENLPTSTLAPQGTPLYKTDYTGFGPRFGVAWQMSEAKGWERVVRGGFGVYYDVGNGGAGSAGSFSSYPFVVFAPRLTNQPFPLPSTLQTPSFPTSVTFPIPTPLTAFARDFRLPYTLQWNLAVEQSLGSSQTLSVSYVAAAGRRLTHRVTTNQLLNGVRQNPNFSNIEYISNKPTSDYHSLQLQFRRRLTQGIQVLANYTWAHAIDEASSESYTTGILEKGNADFDIRHNLSAAVTYELPGRELKGFLGSILGDWWLDSIIHAQSALPVNLSAGTFVREDGSGFSLRPDLIHGQPLYLDDPTVAGGRRFNSAAFALPPIVNGLRRQGTFGRNVMRGLPLYQVDLSLRRQFNLTEKLNLQLRGEAFNVFNHPNFGGYRSNLNVPAVFGTPNLMLGRSLGGLNGVHQIGGPRSIQLSARLSF